MAIERILPPVVGPATPVRFPAISREMLASGLRVWALSWNSVPVVTVALLLEAGSAHDPSDRPGLAALSADLMDEGAGGRDGVALADAFARLGANLSVDAGQDTTSISFTTLARHLDAALALLADVVIRPHLAESDLARVRDLRLSRLRQLKTSPGTAADRAFLVGVFGAHSYAHGPLGTTGALETMGLPEVRGFCERMFVAAGATLIVAGDVSASVVMTSARRHFLDWGGGNGGRLNAADAVDVAPAECWLVDRPGAQQSELRIGHLGPARQSRSHHALTTLNAALGGQFTSRINQRLREEKGYTYGARTGLEFRRSCSTFACDTSVQSDATAEAIADVLAEFAAVGSTRPVGGEELARAQSSITRGYVRQFETSAHLVRAAADLARFGLADDTFDRTVPAVAALSEADLLDAAVRFVRADRALAVVVGDADKIRPSLEQLGRRVVDVSPEF